MSIIEDLQHDHQTLDSIYSRFGMRIVTSSSLSRVFELGRYGFVILSAFRPDYEVGDRVNYKRSRDAGMKEKPHLQNFDRYKSLQQRLRHYGIGYVTLVGQWRDNPDDPVHEELSVFIPYKNAEGAIFSGNPFEFDELAMMLSEEFDQTAYIYSPPQEGNATSSPKVFIKFTGLNRSKDSDPAKGESFDIGSFHVASVEDLYLSTLMRANKSNRVPWKFEEDTNETVPDSEALPSEETPDPLDIKSSLVANPVPMTVGIQWKQMEWAGASIYAQRELLWLLDREEQARKPKSID